VVVWAPNPGQAPTAIGRPQQLTKKESVFTPGNTAETAKPSFYNLETHPNTAETVTGKGADGLVSVDL